MQLVYIKYDFSDDLVIVFLDIIQHSVF
jgi:hypothetical protein